MLLYPRPIDKDDIEAKNSHSQELADMGPIINSADKEDVFVVKEEA